jgi:hypothetical protein
MDPAAFSWGPLILGGAPIGGLYAPVSDEAAAGTLAAAWEAGIRGFDTAPHYGAGVSERRPGSFLAGRPRDEFSVCTKVGRRLVPAAGDAQGEEGFYDIPPLTRVRDYSRARRMRDACASYGIPLPAAALQFTLRHLAVTAAVVGARSAEEITADTSYLSTPIPRRAVGHAESLGITGAFDSDYGGVGRGRARGGDWSDGGGVRGGSTGDGLAEFEAEPGQREVREQAVGDALGGGLDQAEPAVAQHGRDGLGHGGVVECVGQVVARHGLPHIAGHIHVHHERLLDLALPGVHADDRGDAEVPDRNEIRHGTEARGLDRVIMELVSQVWL